MTPGRHSGLAGTLGDAPSHARAPVRGHRTESDRRRILVGDAESQSLRRGYELTIVTDAVTDTARGAHLNSLEVIFPRIAELATTDDVLSAVENTH